MTTQPPAPGEPGRDTSPTGATAASARGEAPRPGGLVGALDAIRRVIVGILAVICVVLFVALVFIVTWQVFTRQVLHNSAPWTEEAARYTFVVLSVFSAAYVFGERGHIAVEMLVEKFGLGAQKVMVFLIEGIVMFFIGSVFVLGGWLLAQNAMNQSLSAIPLTFGQVYMAMPIAGVLILFFCLVRIIKVLAGAEEPFPISDEMEEAI